jgi:hypothetical protein
VAADPEAEAEADRQLKLKLQRMLGVMKRTDTDLVSPHHTSPLITAQISTNSSVANAYAVLTTADSEYMSMSASVSASMSVSDTEAPPLYQLRPPLPADWDMSTESSSSP